jgi:tetratricopeptide (TPR) repeat protein/tRNA A-37 threonylcarbamoyl transferase component Bud32
MIGQKIHHYQITEKLGEGGMGVVYKAEDTKLHRVVALKFLNPALLDSPSEQQRLINEARAAAGLSHPNICTIYEINEYQGQTFIAMAYVEGATLRDRVLSDRIEVHEALRYLIQIADGLKQSHDRDIVHRDIKSANIMLNPAGQAIIMDFGLARRTGAPRKDERFSSGGTSAYMAPEQARGESADQRTDIWSLGVVLYEMIAGQLPFRGDYEQAVIYSILNEAPKPIAELREGVPAQVIAIVDRCLAKAPDDRFQSLESLIREVRSVLDHITGGSRPGSRDRSYRGDHARRPVGLAVAAVLTLVAAFLVYDFIRGQLAGSEVRIPIAVIDFGNETGEEALDGLSGMLITALEQSRRLSVMTRTRMFDVLKNQGQEEVERITESIGQQICRAAGVGALVIPSIRKFGDLYTIDLKVLDTRSNEYIFTSKEEGQGQESIPGMIDQIARDIRVDLRDESGEVESTTSVADVTTPNLEAYQKYFEGERQLNDLDFKKAHASFENAVELDSTFALAYYRLAYTEWWSQDEVGAARDHVSRAMALIDRIPEKERYLVRALEAGLTDGFSAQIPIYQDMRARYPNDKEMLFGLGDAEFHSLNYDSAIVHFERVLEIDPDFDRALQHLTWAFYRTDRFPEAVEVARNWVQRNGSAEAYTQLAAALLMTGEEEEAFATFSEAREREPENFMVQQQLAEFYLSTGRTDLAVADMEAIMTGDSATHESFYAGRVLANQLYPYQGRFHDSNRLLENVGELAAAGVVDSAFVGLSLLTRASTAWWVYEDETTCRELLEQSEALPDKLHTNSYWKSRAVVAMMLGDEDRAREIIDTKVGKLHPIEKSIYAVLSNAFAGRCDRAIAIADSELVDRAFRRNSGVLMSIGRCLLATERYQDVIDQLTPLVSDRRVTLSSAEAIAPCHIMLGRAYEGVGKPDDAVAHYRRALEIWKDGDEDVPMRRRAQERLDALTAARSM